MWKKFPPSVKTLVIAAVCAAGYYSLIWIDELFGDAGQAGVLVASAVLLLYFVIKAFDSEV
jgi:hypothetical protein